MGLELLHPHHLYSQVSSPRHYLKRPPFVNGRMKTMKFSWKQLEKGRQRGRSLILISHLILKIFSQIFYLYFASGKIMEIGRFFPILLIFSRENLL